MMNDFSDRVIERIKGRAAAGVIIELAITEGQELSLPAQEAYRELLLQSFGETVPEPETPADKPMDEVEAIRYAQNTMLPSVTFHGGITVGQINMVDLHLWADAQRELKELRRYLTSQHALIREIAEDPHG